MCSNFWRLVRLASHTGLASPKQEQLWCNFGAELAQHRREQCNILPTLFQIRFQKWQTKNKTWKRKVSYPGPTEAVLCPSVTSRWTWSSRRGAWWRWRWVWVPPASDATRERQTRCCCVKRHGRTSGSRHKDNQWFFGNQFYIYRQLGIQVFLQMDHHLASLLQCACNCQVRYHVICTLYFSRHIIWTVIRLLSY